MADLQVMMMKFLQMLTTMMKMAVLTTTLISMTCGPMMRTKTAIDHLMNMSCTIHPMVGFPRMMLLQGFATLTISLFTIQTIMTTTAMPSTGAGESTTQSTAPQWVPTVGLSSRLCTSYLEYTGSQRTWSGVSTDSGSYHGAHAPWCRSTIITIAHWCMISQWASHSPGPQMELKQFGPSSTSLKSSKVICHEF